MSELDPTQLSRFDRLQNGVEALFAAHTNMVTQYEEIPGKHQGRIALVVRSPGREVVGTAHEPFTTPESVATYVIEETSVGFKLSYDIGADIAAAPTPDERRRLGIHQEAKDISTWLVLFPDNDRHVAHEVRGVDQGRPYTENRRLRPNDITLEKWLYVIDRAEPYNTNTHGILRHEELPDGRRAGPDRIATHAEIFAHKRQVELKLMHPVRRMAVKIFGRLGLLSGSTYNQHSV